LPPFYNILILYYYFFLLGASSNRSGRKNFCRLFDMSEIFSDHHFRKIFNFRFCGERSDFDFCPISENWQKLVWGVGISPPSDLYSY